MGAASADRTPYSLSRRWLSNRHSDLLSLRITEVPEASAYPAKERIPPGISAAPTTPGAQPTPAITRKLSWFWFQRRTDEASAPSCSARMAVARSTSGATSRISSASLPRRATAACCADRIVASSSARRCAVMFCACHTRWRPSSFRAGIRVQEATTQWCSPVAEISRCSNLTGPLCALAVSRRRRCRKARRSSGWTKSNRLRPSTSRSGAPSRSQSAPFTCRRFQSKSVMALAMPLWAKT